MFINLNGKLLPTDIAAVPADARAFRYGYGLFETMLVQDGRIRLEASHWERLKEGMAALGIAAQPYFFKELVEAVQKTIIRNKHNALGRIRIQVWPSSGGLYDGNAFAAQYCIETFPLGEEALLLNENGLVVGIAEGIIKNADAYSHIKSCNALPYALAARQAKQHQWNDALLLNAQGNIVESSIANVFWVKDDVIFTPPLAEGCVAGVMRRHILEMLPSLGYVVTEQPLPPALIEDADAVFLSNAIRGIRWVGSCCGRHLQRGIAADLYERLLGSF